MSNIGNKYNAIALIANIHIREPEDSKTFVAVKLRTVLLTEAFQNKQHEHQS